MRQKNSIAVSLIFVFLLFGCTGGSGRSGFTSDVVPVDIKTARLYANLANAPNSLYAGFAVDTDSPVITSYTGQSALRNFLAKQPAIDEFNQLARQTNYVSGAWIKGEDGNLQLIDDGFSIADNGKYFLWGYLSEALPAQPFLNYQVNAFWQCSGCEDSSGTASGGIQLNMAEQKARFLLDGGQFQLKTQLTLTDKNQLTHLAGSPTELHMNASRIPLDKIAIKGGIFGPNGQNAGLVFGLRSEQHHITGLALGQTR